MSGGYFEYQQYRINDIAGYIEELVGREEFKFSDETKKEFKKAVHILRVAQVYADRIDWLMSGDDVEESFHVRLKKDLEKVDLLEKLSQDY